MAGHKDNGLVYARSERQENMLKYVGIWAAYYRANPHRWVKDFLHISLKLFQIILLNMMNVCSTFVLIASRGIGKTYIGAIFCVYRSVLYPGTKICITSGTRGQSVNVLEKILTEIRSNSPELAAEISDRETSLNANTAKIQFKNGSFIKVVSASDNARSNRAHILFIDEFRMVKKEVIDTVLRKFLASPRHPRFMDMPEYKGKKEYQEPNKTLYLSSGFYQDHWSYTRCRDSCRFMLDPNKHNFVCGLPYQLAIEEDLLMEDEVAEQMSESDFNDIHWLMEMEAQFYGNSADAFYSFDSVNKNRKIEYPMLPNKYAMLTPSLANKTKIPPKVPGEIRLLSADIALMASTRHKNDASAIFINQCLPTKARRFVSNIVYAEANEGYHTEDEALLLRRLFEEYDCDYLVLDTRNVGLSIYDALARDMNDPETGEIYPAISCKNNPDLAARCSNKDAKKAVWAIIGNAKLNSDAALLLREGFRSGRIRLLNSEYDAETTLADLKGFDNLNGTERMKVMLPYINTTLLINELINLQYEDANGLVHVHEKTGMRKDRYSSLSYNFYVATQLEKELHKYQDEDSLSPIQFNFRAPKIK